MSNGFMEIARSRYRTADLNRRLAAGTISERRQMIQQAIERKMQHEAEQRQRHDAKVQGNIQMGLSAGLGAIGGVAGGLAGGLSGWELAGDAATGAASGLGSATFGGLGPVAGGMKTADWLTQQRPNIDELFGTLGSTQAPIGGLGSQLHSVPAPKSVSQKALQDVGRL